MVALKFTGLVILLALSLPRLSYGKGVAIIGDSFSTGAATSEHLRFDPDELWDILKGQKSLNPSEVPPQIKQYLGQVDLDPPFYLKNSSREFSGAFDWMVSNIYRKFNQLFLNSEQYSWAYLLAKKLAYAGDDIYIAAENGARVASILRQADRILDHLQGHLPEEIFIFFTAYDLCAPNVNFMTTAHAYQNSLLKGLKYLVVNGTPPEAGVRVSIVSYMNMGHLLLNSSVLNKEVTAFAKTSTCRTLRQNHFMPDEQAKNVRNLESLYFSHALPPNPAKYCPTMFGVPPINEDTPSKLADLDMSKPVYTDSIGRKKNEEIQSALANHVRHYRHASKNAVEHMQGWTQKHHPRKKFTFQVLDQTELIDFQGADIAQDCFHLSLDGQIKLSQVIHKEFLEQAKIK